MVRTVLSVVAALVFVAAAVAVAHTPTSRAVRSVAWHRLTHSRSAVVHRHSIHDVPLPADSSK
jgi:hypothetical protein